MNIRFMALTVCAMALSACQTTSGGLQSPEADIARRVAAGQCVIGTEYSTGRTKIREDQVYVFSVNELHGDWQSADVAFRGVRDNIYFNLKNLAYACGTDAWRRMAKKDPERYAGRGGAYTKRSLAVQWEGYADLFSGVIEQTGGSSGGKVSVVLPQNEGRCDGAYKVTDPPKGTWNIACTNGLKASGVFTAYGKGKGASGTGLDSEGRKVIYTMGGEL